MVSPYLRRSIRRLFDACLEHHSDYLRPDQCRICGNMHLCLSEAEHHFKRGRREQLEQRLTSHRVTQR